MKVTLDINNDAELRTHIKEAIKGQIASIVREEYYELVKAEIEKKVKSHSGSNIEYYLREGISKTVKALVNSSDLTKTVNKDFVIPIEEQKILETLEKKNWDKLVDEMVKEKLKSLIK